MYRHYPYVHTRVLGVLILPTHFTVFCACSSVITRGSGSNRAPTHSSTTRITPDDTNPTSCVRPPVSAWTIERERLAAAVKELKNEPMIFIAPHATNSWRNGSGGIGRQGKSRHGCCVYECVRGGEREERNKGAVRVEEEKFNNHTQLWTQICIAAHLIRMNVIVKSSC